MVRRIPRPLAVLRRHAVPALVAAAVLASTLLAWRFVAGVAGEQRSTRFREAALARTAELRHRLETYEAMLLAGAGFVEALGTDPTEEQFRRFVESLELFRRYPGIQGFGWTKALRPEEVARHEAAVRAAGVADYRVWPEGVRDLYTAIVYLEPLDWRNRRAIGYDMYSEPSRRAAMARARDARDAAATERVELVQEAGTERQAGFLVYVPVFAAASAPRTQRGAEPLRGWVYGAFRATDLLRAVGAPLGPAMGIGVYDGAPPPRGPPLFEAPAGGEVVEAMDHRIEVGGRPWVVRYGITAAFSTRWERAFPLAVLGAGLLLAVVLFLVTRDETLARARAEDAARRAAFLADAGSVLASDLAYESTIAQVAQLACERITDACVVYLAERTGPVWLVGHADQGLARRAERALSESGLATDVEAGPAAAIRAHRPHVAHRVDPAHVPFGSRAPAVAAVLREARVESALTVPLFARGEALGAISLLRAEGGPELGPADVALAQDLARLATAAIDSGRLYRQAQAALRDRDEFLSVASHELKTPLTSLLLQAETLRTSARRGDPEGMIRKTEVIRRNVDRLSRLVASLLDLSRITAGRLDLELSNVDLAEVARDVVGRFEEEAARAGCRLTLDARGSVVGRWDHLRLDQVITNLVGNAIKYGAGKPVEVRVAAAADRAILSVRDHGIGISADDQRRIFERFERAVSKRNYGGFGLGLWIVRQLLEALGGTVRVESTPGEGAAFVVELAGLVHGDELEAGPEPGPTDAPPPA